MQLDEDREQPGRREREREREGEEGRQTLEAEKRDDLGERSRADRGMEVQYKCSKETHTRSKQASMHANTMSIQALECG